MRLKSWLLCAIPTLGFGALVIAMASAADKKADPPGTAAIMDQLRAQFKTWDADKDDYLDKWELARALRNSSTAYDGTTKPKADKDKSKEDKKETDKGKESSPSSKKPDYSKYVDYQVLTQLDKDGDERISRAEYDDWARDYATQLKQQLDQQNKILQAEKRLAGNLGRQERQQLERQLREEREALERLERRMNDLQRRLRDQIRKQNDRR